jgi:hypothetical protein
VRKYSPILADRLAVSASSEAERVVEEIKVATSVAQRKDEIARDNPSTKVKALVETLTERKEAERLASSQEGAQLVAVATTSIFDEIERIINEGAKSSSVIKFGFGRPMQHILYVNTVHGMYLGVSLRDFAMNSAALAHLEARGFKRQFDRFGQPESEAQIFELLTFKPTFRSGGVIWLADTEEKTVFTTPDLAGYLVDRLVHWVAEQVQ